MIISTEIFYGEYLLGEHTTAAGFKYKATLEGDYVIIEEDYEKHKGKNGFFRVDPPDEVYVGKQLEWIEGMFLNYYQDSLLKKNLPLKLILGKNLNVYSIENQIERLDVASFTAAYNAFIISHGDASIERMTSDDKLKLKEELHKWFLVEKLYSMIYVAMKESEFFSFTDYQQLAGVWQAPYDQLYSMGCVGYKHNNYPLVWPNSLEKIKNNDLKSFICCDRSFLQDVNDKTGGGNF